MEGAGVDEAFGVDLGVGYEEDVVAVSEVKERHADGCEAEDERCDAGVGDPWIVLERSLDRIGTNLTNHCNVGEHRKSATP